MVKSPCKNVCEIENDKCTFCNRTLADISNWKNMSPKERQERMEKLKEKDGD